MSRYGDRTRIGEPVSGFGKKPDAGIGYGVATGGTSSSIVVAGLGNYTMLTFTGAGTLTVTKAGLFDLLIIGGGSSALSSWNGNGRPGSPGGGAGGALETTTYFSTNQTVTIGAGGADPTDVMQFFLGSDSFVGANLGSGSASGRGGAPSWSSGNTAPVPAQKGFDGFVSISNDGGGGGGQGGAATTRNGADGFDWSLWRGEVATTTYYGGGGGGRSSGGTDGTGGLGGGASGGAPAVNATANTGGGGGGGDGSSASGGGSGIVLVRFKV
jgi:hypothetical protein